MSYARPDLEVSTVRLNAMRALYLLITVGMGSIIWPLMFRHGDWSVMHSVASSMLAALTLCTVLGVRYPLQMLPLLLFELAWKAIWLLMIALPLWRSNQLTPEAMSTVRDCIPGVILCPLVIPWKYVWKHYVRLPGDRWRTAVAPAVV
ncbi:MAG TPA: hypothetical protein VF035_02160 [Longimicrobiales bacterium]